MEAIAKFYINLSRIVPVETAEGDAVVEFDAAVGEVDGVQRSGEALAEIFAERKIEGGVLRQIGAGIRLAGKGIAETGSVINVGGSIGAPGQGDVATHIRSEEHTSEL